jgi:putative membrane protein
MVTLTDDDRRRIAKAVADAEAGTSGEICCVLAEEASDYREIPLAWASFAALLLPALAVTLGFQPQSLGEIFSDWSAGQIVMLHRVVLTALFSYVIVQAIVFSVVALVVSHPSVRRVLTPGIIRHHRVRQAARHHFAMLAARLGPGAYVLIYASRLDRMVEIVTSEAVHRAANPATWQNAAKAIGDGLGADRAGDGFAAGIAICGVELEKHFPAVAWQKIHADALEEE